MVSREVQINVGGGVSANKCRMGRAGFATINCLLAYISAKPAPTIYYGFFPCIGVAESEYDTGKNTRGEPKMISGILMGNWNISKF